MYALLSKATNQNGPKRSRIVLQSACESSKFCVTADWNIVQKDLGDGFYRLPNHVTQLLFIDPGSDNIDVLIFAISMALQLLRQLNGSLAEGAIFSSINHKLHCFLSFILAELGIAADL